MDQGFFYIGRMLAYHTHPRFHHLTVWRQEDQIIILAYMEQLGILCLKKKRKKEREGGRRRKKGKEREERRERKKKKKKWWRGLKIKWAELGLRTTCVMPKDQTCYKHSRSVCRQSNARFFGGLNFLCLALFRGRIKVSLAPIKLQFMGLVLKHPSSLVKWNNDSSINRVRAGDKSSNPFPWNLNFM